MKKFVIWLIYMIGYALILISVATLFKNTIQIDNNYFGFWSLVAAIIIYILNRTIKPVIVFLTLPLTALTLGIFYPFINLFILYIVDFLLGNHFEISGIIMGVIVAILISIMNIVMDICVLKPLVNKEER